MQKRINILNKKKLNINNLSSNQAIMRGGRSIKSSLLNCKIFCLVLMLLLVIILQTKFVLGNFVCGQVEDSDDNISASWIDIRIFYPSAPDKFANCRASPAGNKYCCDTEAIPGKSWKIGDVVSAEVFDNESGYMAGPVSVVTSGEGYSVFPAMRLEKVIKIFSPDFKLIFSNESMIFLNASFEEPYNFIELEKNRNKSVLCSNCSKIEQNINAEFGMNYLKLIASHGSRAFSENIVFALLKNYSFERKIECRGCKENVVKNGEAVNISVLLSLSDYAEGLELKEYVPADWEILNTDGKIMEYSESHNLIAWNVSGKDIIKQYTAKAPKIGFFPRKYTFRTELEDKLIAENEVVVIRFFKFFSFDKHLILKSLEGKRGKKYSVIAPNMPLVRRFYNQTVARIAVFPNKIIKNAEFNLENCIAGEIAGDVINCYSFRTNFNEEIEKIFLEFKIEKEILENYESISLYVFDEREELQEVKIEIYGEDGNYAYYRAFLEPCKGMAVVGKNKKTFFSNLIKFLS